MSTESHVRILVIDDYPNWQKLMTEILVEEGYEVDCAGSHDEAKTLIQNNNYKVAILDIRLIDDQHYNVGGLLLLKEIRTYSPRIRVVILTGYPTTEQRELAINEYGADEYISKTNNIEEFKSLGLMAFCELIKNLVNKSE